MDFTITIQLNGLPITWQPGENIAVRERDDVQFFLKTPIGIEPPVLYVEDYKVGFEESIIIEQNALYVTRRGPLFREVFGLSMVRCQCGSITKILTFDVLIHKLQAHQIEEMIRYLYSHSDSLIRVCLARSTLPTGSKGIGNADPETTLSTAERFVSTLLNSR
ncbi:hypothetical protein QN360_18800, partial [Glaciimonas sp. CA11.2]